MRVTGNESNDITVILVTKVKYTPHRTDHTTQVILCRSTSTMVSMKAICVKMVITDTFVGHYDCEIIWTNLDKLKIDVDDHHYSAFQTFPKRRRERERERLLICMFFSDCLILL